MVASITYSSDSIEPAHTPPKKERKKTHKNVLKVKQRENIYYQFLIPYFISLKQHPLLLSAFHPSSKGMYVNNYQ